jgi:maltose O-acetyltransferase
MLAGELYRADDPELESARLHAQEITWLFNATPAPERAERRRLLTRLFEHFGPDAVLEPPFRCDYGSNISVGARSFVNYGSVWLDCNRITIGEDVQMGPGIHLYTATHPLDAATRKSGLESALPIAIGNGVWLGGGTIVCPGVTIGENTVVGAGSVVVRDLPANVLAVGNPCRVVRSL